MPRERSTERSEAVGGSGSGSPSRPSDSPPPAGEGRPLRLWPGVALAALIVVLRYLAPLVSPGMTMVGFFAGLLGGLAVVVWWAFFSRAPGIDRVVGVAAILGALLLVRTVLHASMANAAMGMLFPLYAVPLVSLAFVAWAVLARGLADGPRRASLVVVVLLASAVWTPVRTYGVDGSGDWDFDWRWARSPEERLLAGRDAGALAAVGEVEVAEAEWPGFRGPRRDGVVRGVRIATDWAATPPVELWRRPVGPGWSSFAVGGDLLYTQEQRGEDEVVACYRASTGDPVWEHRDPVRFWEAMAGAGPRATPTLVDGRVYALGATGLLNVLDAGDGSVVWSRDVAAELGASVPGWGFSASPLVTDELVVVAAAGQLAAYPRDGGERRWASEPRGESYSSPHLARIDGVELVLFEDGIALTAHSLADGAVLWRYESPGFHSLQPATVGSGDLVLAVADNTGGAGTRRLAVSRRGDAWNVEERWSSRGLKPYFNDLVIHQGNVYGFDNSILSAVDLETGERRWKGGRYGHGQLVLLADQDLLLVLSERGELALVAARPDGFEELARIAAIEGKTWNHPVVVGDRLYVRNGREMVAFRLPAT